MGDKEFFVKIGEYLVSTSALNFLAVRVILEIKTALEKEHTNKKSHRGKFIIPAAPQAGFGIGGFVGTGRHCRPCCKAAEMTTHFCCRNLHSSL